VDRQGGRDLPAREPADQPGRPPAVRVGFRLQIQQFTENTVITNTASQIDKIKALRTPTEQGVQADAVINSAEDTINKVKANPAPLEQGDPFAQTNQTAKAYGMKVCGQD
jgi:hypothetical protein